MINKCYGLHKAIISIISVLALLSISAKTQASSDAGIDLHYKTVEILITYSVALDYGGTEDCIRDPACMLFYAISLLQKNPELIAKKSEVLMFSLYQGDIRPGNSLALDKNPFEGETDQRTLYDGKADRDLGAQVISLLGHELGLKTNMKNKADYIHLYRCNDKKICNDINFGSMPSETVRSGYCIEPGKGCDENYISVSQQRMNRYFRKIHQ